MTNERTVDLATLVPPGSICPGCKKSVFDVKDWRLGIFGDLLCKVCHQYDQAEHAQLYADPAETLRAKQSLASSIRQDKKPNIRRQTKRKKKTPPVPKGQRCPRCYAAPTERKDWVHVQGVLEGIDWLCATCFYDQSDLKVGQIREDKWFRVFIVCMGDDGKLCAKYPFGYQRVPHGSRETEAASMVLFELQEGDMWDKVGQHTMDIEVQAKRLFSPAYTIGTSPFLTEGDVYDLTLNAFMKAALTHDRNRPFLPYARTLAITNVQKESRKRRYAFKHSGPEGELPDEVTGGVIIHESEFAEYERRIDFLAAQAEFLVGPHNWEVLVQWVLGGRSMREIGEDFGNVSAHRIGTRLKNLRELCQENLPKPPIRPQ